MLAIFLFQIYSLLWVELKNLKNQPVNENMLFYNNLYIIVFYSHTNLIDFDLEVAWKIKFQILWFRDRGPAVDGYGQVL